MEHRKDCAENRTKWLIDRAYFTVLHPNHCRVCNGNGGENVRYDPSAAGVGLSTGFMEEFEYCPECVGNGLCPRCGGILFYVENKDVCQMCGYTTDDKIFNPPAQFECYCYEDEEKW